MENKIAYCGLNCETCDAYLATVNNDDALREKNAKHWTEMNGVEITKEMINCMGCREEGVKTPFCESLCEIRKCALQKVSDTCGDCDEWKSCEKLKMITETNAETKANLEKKSDAAAAAISIGMCLGLCIGVALGTAMNKLGLFMPLGLCFGLCIGVIFERIEKK